MAESFSPSLTIVVPTRNEAGNIGPLLARIEAALGPVPYEVVFVDDSDDGETLTRLEAAAERDARVRFEHRSVSDGLSGAVREGFQLARGDVVAVIDADLQHPPEALPVMVSRIGAGADLVVASRFVAGGGDGGLDPVRKLVSLAARASIWASMKRARALHDPTSGFFAVRRAVLEGQSFQATGWKVLLEVLQHVDPARVAEVPIRFGTRHSGESKLSVAQALDLYRQLWRLLRDSPDDRRFFLFALIGLSGVVVNMAGFLALSGMGLMAELAAPAASTVAMLSNFFWNDRFTYRDRRKGSMAGRGAKAVATQAAGVLIDTAVVALAHAGLGVPAALANLCGIVVVAGWNYGLFSGWVWRATPGASKSPGSCPQESRKS